MATKSHEGSKWRRKLASKFGSKQDASSDKSQSDLPDLTPRASNKSAITNLRGANDGESSVTSTRSDTIGRTETKSSANDSVFSANADSISTTIKATEGQQTFWFYAYQQKKADNPKLISAYEELVAEGVTSQIQTQQGGVTPPVKTTGTTSPPDHLQMETYVSQQMAEIEDSKWQISFSRYSINIRKQVQAVIRTILYCKDAIQPVANIEPHASLAWVGIVILLPLLCSPVEQHDALVGGLAQICSVLCRVIVLEQLYREYKYEFLTKVSSHDMIRLCEQFEVEAVNLLANIIEFQARASCRYARNSLSRYARDIVKADNWAALVGDISEAERTCRKTFMDIDKDKLRIRLKTLTEDLKDVQDTVNDLTLVQNETYKEVARLQKLVSDERYQQCMDAVSTTAYEKHKRAIPVHVHGTCQWLVKHPQYRQWKSAKSDVLWLSADPGSGKTVLAKYLVDVDLKPSPSRATCYFFFKHGLAEQQGLEHAMCALLHQLFQQRPELVRYALPYFVVTGKAYASSVDQMWDVLTKAALDPFAGELVFIVDGLDECDQVDRRAFIQKISSLYLSAGTGDAGALKFLLTSRPYHNINMSFQDLIDQFPHIHLSAYKETAALRTEIDIVIDQEVRKLSKSLNLTPSAATMISSKLKATDNRTYLWLKLIFDDLEMSLGSTSTELAEVIDTIPITVNAAYGTILKNCVNPTKATKIFQLLLVAMRPLTIEELNQAIAADREPLESAISDAAVVEMLSADQIRQICGFFVTIERENVHFFHQTARQFLLSGSMKPGSRIPVPLAPVGSHLYAALSCIRYLVRMSRARAESTERNAWKYTNDTFERYAALNWDKHAAIGLLANDEETLRVCYQQATEVCRWTIYWWAARAKLVGMAVSQANLDLPHLPVQPAQLTVLSMFGIVAAMWRFFKEEVLKGKDSFAQDSDKVSLQWYIRKNPADRSGEPALALIVNDQPMSSPWHSPGTNDVSFYRLTWDKLELKKSYLESESIKKSGEDLFTVAKAESHQFLALLSDRRSLDILRLGTDHLEAEAIDQALSVSYPRPDNPGDVLAFQTFLQRIDVGQYTREYEWTTSYPATSEVDTKGGADPTPETNIDVPAIVLDQVDDQLLSYEIPGTRAYYLHAQDVKPDKVNRSQSLSY